MRGNLRMPRVPEEASQVRPLARQHGPEGQTVVPWGIARPSRVDTTGFPTQPDQPISAALTPVPAHPPCPTCTQPSTHLFHPHPHHTPHFNALAQEAAELMEQCTRLDPSERPSALEVMTRLHAMLAAQRNRPA